ncbi:MAG TPA: exodeoxyribonuclease VII small subunit [Gammaproteobacteria bacterium]|nr:exodeoxyribonuclease VII small subunit [Gammaproteobacteria bacterium]
MSNEPEQPAERSGPEALSFEQAMAELEALVERLESGEQGLEQDLADFQRGIALARQCEGQLKEAEQVVYKLVGEAGEEQLAPFDEDAGEGSGEE